mmetsp:Transcript_93201/g.259079  ORF Transcript_93201/g.259079 Transcript_93201/m.259079 type:complete len:268 (-) Transcript_93201:11-814(-)
MRHTPVHARPPTCGADEPRVSTDARRQRRVRARASPRAVSPAGGDAREPRRQHLRHLLAELELHAHADGGLRGDLWVPLAIVQDPLILPQRQLVRLEKLVASLTLHLGAQAGAVEPSGEVDADVVLVDRRRDLAALVVAVDEAAVVGQRLHREAVAPRGDLRVEAVLVVFVVHPGVRAFFWQLAERSQLVDLLADLGQLVRHLPVEGHVHLGVQQLQQRRQQAKPPIQHGGDSLRVVLPEQDATVHLRQLLHDPRVLCGPTVQQEVL